MRAVVWKGPKKIAVEQVEDPEIQSATDVLVRITTAGIWGSDLHMYGLLAAHSSMLRGAAEVYVIDAIPDRLQKANRPKPEAAAPAIH